MDFAALYPSYEVGAVGWVKRSETHQSRIPRPLRLGGGQPPDQPRDRHHGGPSPITTAAGRTAGHQRPVRRRTPARIGTRGKASQK